MLLELLLFVVSALLLVWFYFCQGRHPSGFPPGPRATLPFIGDALAIGSLFVEGFDKLADKWVSHNTVLSCTVQSYLELVL